MIDYRKKYLKYKSKYLYLKGGKKLLKGGFIAWKNGEWRPTRNSARYNDYDYQEALLFNRLGIENSLTRPEDDDGFSRMERSTYISVVQNLKNRLLELNTIEELQECIFLIFNIYQGRVVMQTSDLGHQEILEIWEDLYLDDVDLDIIDQWYLHRNECIEISEVDDVDEIQVEIDENIILFKKNIEQKKATVESELIMENNKKRKEMEEKYLEENDKTLEEQILDLERSQIERQERIHIKNQKKIAQKAMKEEKILAEKRKLEEIKDEKIKQEQQDKEENEKRKRAILKISAFQSSSIDIETFSDEDMLHIDDIQGICIELQSRFFDLSLTSKLLYLKIIQKECDENPENKYDLVRKKTMNLIKLYEINKNEPDNLFKIILIQFISNINFSILINIFIKLRNYIIEIQKQDDMIYTDDYMIYTEDDMNYEINIKSIVLRAEYRFTTHEILKNINLDGLIEKLNETVNNTTDVKIQFDVIRFMICVEINFDVWMWIAFPHDIEKVNIEAEKYKQIKLKEEKKQKKKQDKKKSKKKK